MTVRIQEIVIDCSEDPALLAAFWAEILEARWGSVHDDWAIVDASPLRLAFQRVPEPKTGKNRLHLDVQVADLDAATDTAVARGARVLAPREGTPTDGYIVLADPWGDEFCFVADASGAWNAGQIAAFDRRPRRHL